MSKGKMMKQRNISENFRIYIIFFVGILLLLVQHRFVELYFDDFGNASLSYGYSAPNVQGTNWSIADLIEWVKWCYNNWGGRILYAVTLLFPLIKHSSLPFMTIQALVIGAILWMIYKIVIFTCKKKTCWQLAVMLFVLYALIGQNIHKWGTYWASASVLYVWPILPFLVSVYLYEKTEDLVNINKWSYAKINIYQVFLTFWASFSQEQVGASVVVCYILIIGIKHWKKWRVYWKTDIIVVVSSIVSYLLLFMAPGNFARLSTTEFSKMSLWEKIQQNFPIIIRCFFTDGLRWINFLMAVVVFYAAYRLTKENKKAYILMVTSSISLILCAADFFIVVFMNGIYGIFFGVYVMTNMVVTLTIYMAIKKRFIMIALMYAGGISVGCMVISPTINLRSYIEYIYIVFTIIGCMLVDWHGEYKPILCKVAGYVSWGILIIAALRNYGTILKGYYQNYPYLEYNDKVLKNYGGEEIISLKKCPNTDYRGPMPYEEAYEVTEYWMKEYYDIPMEIQFVWTE